MTNPALADPRERRYLSPYSGDGVGLLIHRLGQLADADGDVETSLVDEEGNPAFTAVADKVDTGSYVTLNSPQQTARSGLFTVRWNYALGGVNQSYESYVEIGQPNPSYDNLPEGMKDVIEMCWMRFADLYDSPAGGPHFQTYFQTHYNRGRMADLLRIAMGTLNTVSQPWTTFSVEGVGGQPFPLAQWGPLLERALYIEALKHLIRTYVEIPLIQASDSLTRLDRRDYMQRWQAILADEQATLKSQLDSFKIAQMGLGNSAILVGGGLFGRYGPTLRAGGSMAARPRMWSRFYG